uniref:Uncharacterized protein LOC100176394 n=1 Tax=Phallusia mammillata TaxID=59560 RepID=A0A6F9DFR6_9ASCI|nr:uncharacterized protein LOC100176394 [Phallusia mammillata]
MNHFKCSWVISGEFFYSQLATKTHLRIKFNNTAVTFQTNRSGWKTVIHISDCGNVTLPGVVQDVPVNKGYLSTHTFSCIQPFYLPATAVAVCQSDATWNVTSFCTKVQSCNNTDIPSSDLYQQPTSGTTYYPYSKTLICNQHYIGNVTAQCSKQGTWNITNTCTAKGFPVGYIVGILLVAEVVVFIVICSICFSYKKILKRKSSRQHDQHKISAESSSSSRDMRIINVPMGAVSDEYTPLIGKPGLRRRKNIPTTNTPTEKDDISTQVQNYVDLLQTKKFDEAKAIKQQLLRSIESQLEITADDLEVETRKLRNNHDYLEAILFFSITADFCVKKTPDFAVAKHVAEYAGEIKETIKLFMENSDSSSESRNREIVRDHVIPLMREIIQQIRDFQIDEKIRCEQEVWCLHHIERSQDYIGDLTSRETTIKLGLELMESKFGNESSKYSIYGTLLNNLGAVCEETSRIKEAIVYYTKAIEVYKTAEDLTEKQRVAEIEHSEKNINFCK